MSKMEDITDVVTESSSELLAVGRRHLAVRDYTSAVSMLASACELLVKEHGDFSDQCAEAYLWYGKALLGLAREERGVLGDKIPDSGNEDDDEDEEQEEKGEAKNEADKADAEVEENGEADSSTQKSEAQSTTKDNEPVHSSTIDISEEQPGTSNGEANDESMVNLDDEDDVDNLQLAWEMLDMARNILNRRAEGGSEDARGLLAEVHLTLGEVALESETYDKAVIDMISCLEIQKALYAGDDRRIAETHYQIALANSLASNFEEAITHFKNAANILETKIKTLETPNPEGKTSQTDVEAEIKELKELLPEIQVKIQDMMDYKSETIKKVRDALYPSNGQGSSSQSNGASSSTAPSQAPAKDISHLIKRKRKASDSEESSAKRTPSS